MDQNSSRSDIMFGTYGLGVKFVSKLYFSTPPKSRETLMLVLATLTIEQIVEYLNDAEKGLSGLAEYLVAEITRRENEQKELN